MDSSAFYSFKMRVSFVIKNYNLCRALSLFQSRYCALEASECLDFNPNTRGFNFNSKQTVCQQFFHRL